MKKDAYIIVCVQVNFSINQSSILNECMTDSDCNDTDVSLVVEVLLISSTYFKFNTLFTLLGFAQRGSAD